VIFFSRGRVGASFVAVFSVLQPLLFESEVLPHFFSSMFLTLEMLSLPSSTS